VYFRPELGELGGGALVQWLVTLFLADRTVRFAREAAEGQGDASAAGAAGAGDRVLRLPVATQVDYRSACFHTGALIDQGFVCSVCLTIYGKEVSSRLSLPRDVSGYYGSRDETCPVSSGGRGGEGGGSIPEAFRSLRPRARRCVCGACRRPLAPR